MHSPKVVTDQDILNSLTSTSIEQSFERFKNNIILSKTSLSSNTSSSEQDFRSLSSPCAPTEAEDTIHYLSPATASTPLSTRTVNEEDSVYEPNFMHLFLDVYGKEADDNYSFSTVSCVEPELQRTLAIVKPAAMKYEDVILRAIGDAGLTIIHKRRIHLTPEQVSEIYVQYYGTQSFPHMVVKMSVGPILVLCLAGINAVSKWKEIVGPEHTLRADWFYPMSMRVRFGLQNRVPDTIHASENLRNATIENIYFNPDGIIEPIITEENKVSDYCNLYINPTLSDGLAEVVKVKPKDPVVYLADWLLRNNPYQPRFSQDISILPT